MNAAALANYLSLGSAARGERAHCRQLAAALTARARIDRYDNSLVALIGKRGDRTNLDALSTWIGKELAGAEPDCTDVLDYLFHNLEERLEWLQT